MPSLSRRKFIAASASSLLLPSLSNAAEKNSKRSRWEMIFTTHETVASPHIPQPKEWGSDEITAAWIGHSTVLINFFGTTILTDPAFSERIGINVLGLFTAGPKRLVFPALNIDALPPVDIVLLSHAHMDHLDVPTLKKLSPAPAVIMAKNTKDVVEDLDFQSVKELDWGESITLADVHIEALRVKHFGWRYPWEEDRSRGNHQGRSFNAYLITKNGKHIVFGGDTSFHDHFKIIGERGLTVELAIMPIGAYDPWIHNHASPEQAVAMADQMNAGTIFPIHWGTIIQSDEPAGEPIERLLNAAGRDRVAVTAIGQTWKNSPAKSNAG